MSITLLPTYRHEMDLTQISPLAQYGMKKRFIFNSKALLPPCQTERTIVLSKNIFHLARPIFWDKIVIRSQKRKTLPKNYLNDNLYVQKLGTTHTTHNPHFPIPYTYIWGMHHTHTHTHTHTYTQHQIVCGARLGLGLSSWAQTSTVRAFCSPHVDTMDLFSTVTSSKNSTK